MLEIDPQFRRMGQGARRRRLRVGLLRGAALVLVLGLAAGLGWHYAGPDLAGRFAGQLAGDDSDEVLVPLEQDIAIAPVVRGDTFTDIPGDPMIIQTGENGDKTGTTLAGPPDLAATRAGPPGPERLTMVRENLHVRERRLIAALPTTREEFALFQAERSRERLMNASVDATEALSIPEAERSTSSIAFTRAAAIRPALWQDLIVQIRLPTDLAELLGDNGFDAATAARTSAQMAEVMQIDPKLPRGSLLALRYRMQAGQRQVLQLSIYRSGEYVGSMAMSGSGRLVSAADPWADQPLLDQSADESVEGDSPQFRLLDVIYSAALRQGVPGDVIGEAIALMAKVHDLDGFAAEGDRLQLLYANNPGAGADGAGQILFIGVTGPSGDKPCYVVPAREGGYECHAPGARVVALTDQPAMSAPVAGVLSRRFVAPTGAETGAETGGDADSGTVAWQAAQGSPVAAIAAGRVTALDAGAGSLSISHDGGLASSYRGLENLPSGLAPGADVKRGAVIGRIAGKGEDDRSGLVFQLLKDGQPVDPIPYLAGGNEVLASNAVEALISRIIHVESGGNAAARNPLSTATGLGQFIESTWLRMMRSYRPDLVATMDRGQLLDLRLEPSLSRQMVRHLAQENEAFLRARGINATSGNLYLAHFLGPMGAAQALSADPAASVGSVMGANVVNANPFLRNYTIADLRAWSDRKMNAQSVTAATSMPATVPVRASPEVERFVALMDRVLSTSQN